MAALELRLGRMPAPLPEYGPFLDLPQRTYFILHREAEALIAATKVSRGERKNELEPSPPE
jgi:hypothetical protein